MLINPKFLANKVDDFNITERIQNLSAKQGLGITAGIGGAAGLVNAGMDDDDDSLGSSLGKGITGAALTSGTAVGVNALMNKTQWGENLKKEMTAGKVAISGDRDKAEEVVSRQAAQEKSLDREIARTETETEAKAIVQQAEKNKVTSGKVTTEEVKAKHDAGFDKLAKEKKMKSTLQKGKLIGGIGLGLFAVASVMDTSNKLGENKAVSRMKEEEEQSLIRKQNQEKKNQNQYSYGYMTGGDIVGELWNNRLGHHKMGNAKFQ